MAMKWAGMMNKGGGGGGQVGIAPRARVLHSTDVLELTQSETRKTEVSGMSSALKYV